MIISPIIPIWLMTIISVILIAYLIYTYKKKIPFLKIIAVLLLFAINLRVMIPSDNVTVQTNNLNVLFVIDTTLSMQAADYSNNQTRLDQVKKDCEHIIKNLNGAKFSVISFDNNSKILVPFTSDADLALNSIKGLTYVNNHYATGTSLDMSVKDMKSVLESSKKNKNETRANIVFYISDGELIGKSDELGSFKSVRDLIDNGAVLGYGTEAGGYMKIKDRYTEQEEYVTYYDENYRERKGVSKIDEGNLKKIAEDLKTDYIYMNKQSNIDKKLKEIVSKSTVKMSDEQRASYDDTYYFLIIPLLIVLVFIYKKYKEDYTL